MTKLNSLIYHDYEPVGERNGQTYGKCPFCGGEEKFYANLTNWLWDCKKCGRKGNFSQFLDQISKEYSENLNSNLLDRISKNRCLPVDAFQGYGLGVKGLRYTLPVRDFSGACQDIRIYRLNDGIRSTPGCTTGLLGAELVSKLPINEPIYVCEGEWDGIAWRWVLRRTKKPGGVVSVPGASVFKKEWIQNFKGRSVISLYDNDLAGENGECTLKERLTGSAKDIKYLRWNDGKKSGYDIRDLVVDNGTEKAFEYVQKNIQSDTRKKEPLVIGTSSLQQPSTAPETTRRIKLKEVYEVMGKWLFLKNFRAIEALFATYLSNVIEGDPLWMFFVAPPGGSKTELLYSLFRCEDAYCTSSLTSHALISGSNWGKGGDPSLIPKLDKKTLVLKDWTTILSKREQEKEEIYGILRDAFDGRCGKIFGNGVIRNYQSRFTVIAAVTTEIYNVAHEMYSLGERFLKYFIGDNLTHEFETQIINRSISNSNKENQMREEIQGIVHDFMYWRIRDLRENLILPDISPQVMSTLITLSKFGARMRGTVPRDRFRPEVVSGMPSCEVGSRLGKQISKLAMSLALLNERPFVNENDLQVCRKVIVDTIPQRTETLVRSLYELCPTVEDYISTKEISIYTKMPSATVSRVLADLCMLRIVRQGGKSNAFMWTLESETRKMIENSGLYQKTKKEN